MGRPKGSKNKRKDYKKDNDMSDQVLEPTEVETDSEVRVNDNPDTNQDEQDKVKPTEDTNSSTEVTKSPKKVTVAIDEEADQQDSYGGTCQNCLNHNKVTELNRDGTCPTCGFDKKKLYGAF